MYSILIGTTQCFIGGILLQCGFDNVVSSKYVERIPGMALVGIGIYITIGGITNISENTK
jgi:hypothetical protein